MGGRESETQYAILGREQCKKPVDATRQMALSYSRPPPMTAPPTVKCSMGLIVGLGSV